jgi:integrase
MTAAEQTPGVRMYRDEGYGIKVYEPRSWIPGDPFRATYIEGRQRRYLQAVSEAGMAVKVERARERLATGADRLEQPGVALIAHYLSPDRHPAGGQWSRKHADTQRRLCERFVAPVIATITCQDICESDMEQIVNSAPTKGEGERLRRCLRAIVNVGNRRGYLLNSTLWDVPWQPEGRPVPAEKAQVQGESVQWVDPAEIPSDGDIAKLAHALSAGRRGELDELMAYMAAYSGLRQGEQFALTADQVAPADDERTITVDRKVIEVSGKLYVEPPKMRKYRRMAYPVLTPDGYPLAEKIAARVEAARAEMAAGTNPLGLMFPSPRGTYWRASNFSRRVLAPAYLTAGWRNVAGGGAWTWHSLRHVFCTTALFTWKLDPRDVAQMAGHANSRVTTDMYVGAIAGVLERVRLATAAD